MTVFENVLVGATYGRGQSERASYETCAAALERTGLLGQANELAETLTLLERKRLELARALATEPQVLLLDEIAGGLTDQEVHALIATIKDLRAEGVTHHLDRAHRPRAACGRRPAVGHRLRPQGHGGRPDRR